MTLLSATFEFSSTTMKVDDGLDLCGMARYAVGIHSASRLWGVSESIVGQTSQAMGMALR